MPFEQTPSQPQAFQSEAFPPQPPQPDESGRDARDGELARASDFAESLAGESGDPIWESSPPQADAGRAEPARRAAREPEGKLPPGRMIDLIQGQGRKAGA